LWMWETYGERCVNDFNYVDHAADISEENQKLVMEAMCKNMSSLYIEKYLESEEEDLQDYDEYI